METLKEDLYKLHGWEFKGQFKDGKTTTLVFNRHLPNLFMELRREAEVRLSNCRDEKSAKARQRWAARRSVYGDAIEKWQREDLFSANQPEKDTFLAGLHAGQDKKSGIAPTAENDAEKRSQPIVGEMQMDLAELTTPPLIGFAERLGSKAREKGIQFNPFDLRTGFRIHITKENHIIAEMRVTAPTVLLKKHSER
ncbi:hypothetical protein HZC09_05795 [Candidatus Micrarchaeota archaeon]|nr:hypothetical protein [Candidatus Micrarchaeota archaeon]